MEPDADPPGSAEGPVARPPGSVPAELRTERLLLRGWRADDREPFAAMNADPEVMRWIGSGPLDRVSSDGMRARLRREWARAGRGLWVVERLEDGAFLGFCGLTDPAWGGPALRGELEIGWRLARHAWGHGYAGEAADACIRVAWDALGLQSVIALVHPDNERSLGVGEHLGMRVAGTTRHTATGWEILVLRAHRPVPGDADTPATPDPPDAPG